MVKKYLFITFILNCLIPLSLNSQIPTIKAVCGEGQNIDWAKIKAETERLELEEGGGPGFFYHDCDQGVNPIKASSTLANQGKYNYGIKNINDNDPMSAWVEGKLGYGIGEFFEIKAAGINTIYNGYQFSPKSWIENSRVKKFKVYRNNIAICFLELTDEMGRQSFELPDHNSYNPLVEYIFKFEILEVYKGSKWQDVAISEINLGLCCISESSLINTPTNSVNISKLQENILINSIDIETGEVFESKVKKISKQRHLSLFKIICETKELELTSNHPLYIKNIGFCSISKYMELCKTTNYEDLIDKVEFGIWNDLTKSLNYEKLKEIKLINGIYETYTISSLSQGSTYISNGFISRTY
jgi:hypothetical protein